MSQLSVLACGSYLGLTVHRPAVTVVGFAKLSNSRHGVWCYLNVIVFSWHITCSAEL